MSFDRRMVDSLLGGVREVSGPKSLSLRSSFSGPNVEHQLLSPRFCRADFGVIFYFGPANLTKIAGEFLSEF